MNRTIAPSLKPIESIALISPIVKKVADQCELIWIKDVPDETCRFELHFKAGTIQGDVLIAGLTNALLLSGTKEKSTTQIHDELAQLGAYITMQATTEEALVGVFFLREYFDRVVEIVFDAIQNVIFPSHEIDDIIRDRKQTYLVNSKKMSVLARRLFAQHFFVNDARYGRIAAIEEYDTVDPASIVEFHQQFYLKGLTQIICVANIEEPLIDKWCRKFAAWNCQQESTFIEHIDNKAIEIYEEKEEAVQTAIRLGFPLFNKTNKDFVGVYVLQTILGSYFGSRLMSNLREDKGYTYGIGSGIAEMRNTGYLIIATEVKKEVHVDALHQIKLEIQRLKEETIGEGELQLVKNYLLGQLLKDADGSDALMDLYLSVNTYGLDLDFYNDFIERVKNITAEELLELAKKYLKVENATIIKVG